MSAPRFTLDQLVAAAEREVKLSVFFMIDHAGDVTGLGCSRTRRVQVRIAQHQLEPFVDVMGSGEFVGGEIQRFQRLQGQIEKGWVEVHNLCWTPSQLAVQGIIVQRHLSRSSAIRASMSYCVTVREDIVGSLLKGEDRERVIAGHPGSDLCRQLLNSIAGLHSVGCRALSRLRHSRKLPDREFDLVLKQGPGQKQRAYAGQCLFCEAKTPTKEGFDVDAIPRARPGTPWRFIHHEFFLQRAKPFEYHAQSIGQRATGHRAVRLKRAA